MVDGGSYDGSMLDGILVELNVAEVAVKMAKRSIKKEYGKKRTSSMCECVCVGLRSPTSYRYHQ